MFVYIGLLLAIGSLSVVTAPPGHGTLMCYECHDVTDISHCTRLVNCHHLGDGRCFTRVGMDIRGHRTITKGCTSHEDCYEHNTYHVLIGKRNRIDLCGQCCIGSQCNYRSGCESYITSPPRPTTTSTKPTTTKTTTKPTTTTAAPLPLCRDHEVDGFKCSDYDTPTFCTDTSVLAHKLAYERCPQHCGFCDASGNYLPIPSPPPTTVTLPTCRDHEVDGFLCSDYDHLNFCTDSSSFAHILAYERCPQHCGFCDTNGHYKETCIDHEQDGFKCSDYDAFHFCTDTSSVAHKLAIERCPKHCGLCGAPISTADPATTLIPTTAVVKETAVTTTQSACFDDEDHNFSCAQWASYGFCQGVPGTGHDLAVKRCSKYCGFCS